MLELQGFIDKDTGEVAMDFVAEFNFSAYKFYKVDASIAASGDMTCRP